jgi:hypothetical protein
LGFRRLLFLNKHSHRSFITCEVGLDLSIKHQHEGTTGTTENVGKGTLKESSGAFVRRDLSEAIHSTSVLDVGTGFTGLHHQSTTDGIKRVGGDAGTNSNDLGEHPHGKDVSGLGIGEKEGLSSVEHTEIAGTVSDDTNNGDTETTVKTSSTIGLSDLHEAVNETSEFTTLSGTNISSEAGTGEIKRVDDAKGSSTSGTTGSHVTHEELYGFLLLVVGVENLLVKILEGEVEGLSGEIAHNIGQVTAPESGEALLAHNTAEAITNTLVLITSHVLHGVLNLEEQLNALNRGNSCLRDGGGATADHKVLYERCFFLTTHLFFVFM